ncbi:hypothetical protein RHMOL_Rhmol04G0215800 [Rhododendron molle]|uniref:Uncharacterized protein n=1 Tax=Rhododendron molle TaxID=49168 RepID=A0ACC0P442_RHOML|nr:hypothetical protein RHMOL_Rhmol04G0215800 [Rhododendron molle]
MGTIDSQLQELNTKFKEDTIELLILSTTLDPRDGYKSFKVEDICKLAEKYYPSDFTEQEKLHNRMEDDFLESLLITYIEKDIAKSFDADSIIDAFNDMKEHRIQFKMPHFSR